VVVTDLVLAGVAALGAGFVNAIAGGGSLITFPALVALGVPPVAAAATNTVALCPGYFGAALAQRKDLAGQRARMVRLLPVAAIGGVGGALLLLATGEAAFGAIVPFLILAAAVLLGAQDAIKRRVVRPGRAANATPGLAAAIPVALAATYGGYFGAGMGVMILAALAIFLDETLPRINALKQTISLVVNVSAAAVFALSPSTRWALVPGMALGALAGGLLGGALSARIPVRVLRAAIVTLGVAISAYYFIRLG
jgi:hypothetical protein